HVPKLSAAQEEAAYRIAQEALHNALRHADARHVDVRLDWGRNDSVIVEIVDDGHGLHSVRPDEAARRLGIASMRERARAVGGRLEVTSPAGAGTTVRLEVPTDV